MGPTTPRVKSDSDSSPVCLSDAPVVSGMRSPAPSCVGPTHFTVPKSYYWGHRRQVGEDNFSEQSYQTFPGLRGHQILFPQPACGACKIMSARHTFRNTADIAELSCAYLLRSVYSVIKASAFGCWFQYQSVLIICHLRSEYCLKAKHSYAARVKLPDRLLYSFGRPCSSQVGKEVKGGYRGCLELKMMHPHKACPFSLRCSCNVLLSENLALVRLIVECKLLAVSHQLPAWHNLKCAVTVTLHQLSNTHNPAASLVYGAQR